MQSSASPALESAAERVHLAFLALVEAVQCCPEVSEREHRGLPPQERAYRAVGTAQTY